MSKLLGVGVMLVMNFIMVILVVFMLDLVFFFVVKMVVIDLSKFEW